MKQILVKCMQGIGDQIYMRPFIKEISQDPENEVFVRSVLPDLYHDLNVKFVDPGKSDYRTQQKNFANSKVSFVEAPKGAREISCHYGPQDLKARGIMSHMEHSFGLDMGTDLSFCFDLPHWPEAEEKIKPILEAIPVKKRLAVVRPVTHRREWTCTSRSPYPHYINWCAKVLRECGYYVISIADCAEGEEWIDGEAPPADLSLHSGELGIYGTLTLLKKSDIVIGGSGFIIPAAVAANTNLFVIFGGRGAYDNPHKVFDLRMDLRKIGWAMPDDFCRCNKMEHNCDKTISDLDDQFFSFMARL